MRILSLIALFLGGCASVTPDIEVTVFVRDGKVIGSRCSGAVPCWPVKIIESK